MKTSLSHSRGFTLVELLIVITLIALLAVAVLSAINPIEQFNKARDTARQADAAQLLNAIERYYTNNERYPWNADFTEVSEAVPGTDAMDPDIGVCGNAACSTNGDLIVQGELKDSFRNRRAFKTDRPANDILKVVKALNATDINVCFIPGSSSFRETRVMFPAAGNSVDISGSCAAGTVGCYVCLPASGQQ